MLRTSQGDTDGVGERSCGLVVFGCACLTGLSPSFMLKLWVNFAGFSRLTPMKSDVLEVFLAASVRT